jgi:hypothetical protein
MDIGYSVMSIVLYLILFLKKLHCTTKMINSNVAQFAFLAVSTKPS